MIKTDTQIGDLLQNPVTREYLMKRLSTFLDALRGAVPEEQDFVEVLVRFMPLHTLRSMIHITNEELQEMCEDLRKLVENPSEEGEEE